MHNIVKRTKSILDRGAHVLKTDGPLKFTKRGSRYLYYRRFPEKRPAYYRDILFINGCELPHPTRYRVNHQIEQLRSHGLTADSVFYDQLNLEMLKYYRGFVFFRCPVTDVVKEFIKQAKESNKTCFFDIDDLVIDQKYTDQIEYVKNMSTPDKNLYDDGVNRMRETLSMCDYAITTTERLQTELEGYINETFVNRNVASDEMVGRSIKALRTAERDSSRVVIGYFSGSITHNEDIELVLPVLVKLLKKHSNLYIKIAGILDVPNELQPFQDRIIGVEFMDWRTMPQEMATCDINIAPLKNTIFNEAKSENKWTEASLVKVVTVASNLGAFKKVVEHDATGILVDDTGWFDALDDLITNRDKRELLGSAAYKKVLQDHTTLSSGYELKRFIQDRLARNIAFMLPSTDISGGVNVILKHAEILQRNGWDVTLIDAIEKDAHTKAQMEYDYRLAVPGYNVITKYRTRIEADFDVMVATLWSTLKDVRGYSKAKRRLYFVQNMETDFYEPGATELRVSANATYCDNFDVEYVTMSLWCQKWLKQRFNKESKYASNGIDLQYYPFRKRDFSGDKIKILIEGDSSSEYKNTDEAFRIVEKLDPNKFEVSYLSYRKEPKDWYRVDRFYSRIAPEKVGEVYSKCDILLKTSLLESFSYPPLEMMATGGVSVVVPNEGNVEYLVDGQNCLFYTQGDIEEGASKVELLLSDEKLRNRIIKNGLNTARNYTWEQREDDIVLLYK